MENPCPASRTAAYPAFRPLLYAMWMLAVMSPAAAQEVRNPDFREGLAPWRVKGDDVSVEKRGDGAVLLIRSGAGRRMSVEQPVAAPGGDAEKEYEILLDLRAAEGELSGEFFCVKTRPPWTRYYGRPLGALTREFREYRFLVPGRKAEPGDQAVFRLVLEGEGRVELRRIEVLSRPLSDAVRFGNQLVNPDFAAGTAGWTIGGGAAEVTPGDGTPTLWLTPDAAGRVRIQQVVEPPKPGETQRVRFRLKAEGDWDGEALCAKQTSPWTQYWRQPLEKPGPELREYEHAFATRHAEAEGPAVFRLDLSGRGRVALQHVFLGTDPSSPSTAEASAVEGANWLEGGGFELGDGVYTVGWSGYTRENGGYKNVVEAYRHQDGDAALRRYDTEDKVEGERSLLLTHHTEPVRTYLLSTPVPTGASTPRAALFSVYCRARDGKAAVDLEIRSGPLGQKQETTRRSFSVGDAWTRLAVSGPATRQAQAVLTFRGKGRLNVDAAMLEFTDAEEPSPFQPRDTLDAFVGSDAEFGVMAEGEPQRLWLEAVDRRPDAGPLTARVVVTDYREREIRRFDVPLPAGAPRRRVELPDPQLPLGYFKVAVALRGDGAAEVRRENAVAVIPARDPRGREDSPIGFHMPAGERYFRLARRLGVSMLRHHNTAETKWQVVEPEPGRFVDVDDLLAKYERNGLSFLAALDEPPLWASPIEPDFPSLAKFNMPQDLWYWAKLFPPREPRRLEDYVRHMVTKYGHRTKYWETWNEVCLVDDARRRVEEPFRRGFVHLTLEELLDLSRRIYETVKNVDPEAVVVGQYACQEPYDQFDRIIPAGGLRYVDKLAVHFYQGLDKGTPPDEPSRGGRPPLRPQLAHWRSLMEQSGRTVGIWDTEFGVCRTRTNYGHRPFLINWEGEKPATALNYVVKSYLVRMSLGIEKIFYYAVQRPDYVMGYAPLLEFDSRPAPALPAFAAMTSLFDRARFEEDPLDDERAHIIKARVGDEWRYAVWLKAAGRAAEWDVPTPDGAVCLDVMGRVRAESPVRITEEPVYWVAAESMDELLLAAYRKKSVATGVAEPSREPDLVPMMENTGLAP